MNTTTLNPPIIEIEPPAAAVGAAAVGEAGTGEASGAIGERGPEISVSLLLAALGALVMFDSLRLGAGWADDGPQSGYFPFYIGLMLAGSSGFVLARALRDWVRGRAAARGADAGVAADSVFVEHEQLRLVMAMLVPATLYVVAMGFTGLYVASIALIVWFMRRHGRFGWGLSTAVSVGVPATVFVVFERWFLVPLPKGPLESLLGL